MQRDLFAPPLDPAKLSQWFTPCWAAELIVERHFSHLTPSDLVLDPMAGSGNLLAGVPAPIPAIGIEIDPRHAARARERTNRRVIEGDFRDTMPRLATFDLHPTMVLANPPFVASTIVG
jgi:predicted RNA methylase